MIYHALFVDFTNMLNRYCSLAILVVIFVLIAKRFICGDILKNVIKMILAEICSSAEFIIEPKNTNPHLLRIHYLFLGDVVV